METNNKIFISQANQVIDINKPIVFWDTCTLLDIIRMPKRDKLPRRLSAYEQLLHLIENDNIVSVTSDLVIHEFENHYEKEKQSLTSEQSHRKNQVKEFAAYMNEPEQTQIVTSTDLLHVETRLEEILLRIWRKTYIIKSQKEFAEVAHSRMEMRIPPAKIKDEYKDCYIWTCFQKFALALPGHNYITFITSNTEDYKDEVANSLFPELQAECASSNTKIHFNIGQMFGEINGIVNP